MMRRQLATLKCPIVTSRLVILLHSMTISYIPGLTVLSDLISLTELGVSYCELLKSQETGEAGECGITITTAIGFPGLFVCLF